MTQEWSGPDRRAKSDYDPEVLSRAELRAMFREEGERIVERAISTTFDALGVDITDTNHRNALRADFTWVRSVREASAAAGKTVRNVGLAALVTAILAAVWTGFKVKIGGN